MPANARQERAEFERLALPHMDALYSAGMRLCRNPRDAEDLLQETYLRAYRFWNTLRDREEKNCKSWLFKILSNTFINQYQKRKRGREILDAATTEQNTTDGVLISAGAFSQKNPEAILFEKATQSMLETALKSVPEEFRLAVILCDVEGFSYKEIADIMECPVGTVMSRLHRGRRLLREAVIATNRDNADAHSASVIPFPSVKKG